MQFIIMQHMQSGGSLLQSSGEFPAKAIQSLKTSRRDGKYMQPLLHCGIGLFCAALWPEHKISGLQELYSCRNYITCGCLSEDKFLNGYHSPPPSKIQHTTVKLLCIMKDSQSACSRTIDHLNCSSPATLVLRRDKHIFFPRFVTQIFTESLVHDAQIKRKSHIWAEGGVEQGWQSIKPS